MDVTRVLLVEPRGFRAGVNTAMAALAWVVALEGPSVYCLHKVSVDELPNVIEMAGSRELVKPVRSP